MHRLSIVALTLGSAFAVSAQGASANEIGTFPSVDGAWEVTLATLPQGGRLPPLDPWHVVSLEARVAPRGTAAARSSAEDAVVRIPLADAAPAPLAVPAATPEAWVAGVLPGEGGPSIAPAAESGGSQATEGAPAAPAPGDAPAAVAAAGLPGLPAPAAAPDDPLAVAPAPDATPSFDARMPRHGHGLYLKPRLAALAPDVYRIDGVKLHMAGEWELSLTLPAGGGMTRFLVPVEL